MKKIFLTLMVVGAVATAHASEKDNLIKNGEEFCEATGSLAGTIMSAHQNGVPMAKVLNKAYLTKFDKKSVLQAYSTPRFSTENFQSKAIADFRDKRHLDCLQLISQYISGLEDNLE